MDQLQAHNYEHYGGGNSKVDTFSSKTEIFSSGTSL
jgi:hypothetical protein